jgi:lia operon protein LiaG
MTSRPVVPASLACLVTLLAAATAGAQQVERFTLPASRSAVYDLVGEIQVTAGTAKDVVIEVTRGGKDAAELTIERGPVETFEALRIIFPSDEIVYPRMSRWSNSNFHVREDGTFGSNSGDGGRHRGRNSDRGGEVRIRGSGSGLEAYADLKISLPVGAEFAVHVGVGKAMISNVNGHLVVDAASAGVTAQSIKGFLDIDVGSGDVTVTNADAELSIDTGSGDVHVTGVRGKDLSIDTGSGEVNATDLTVEKASVETGSGNLTLSGVSGANLHFETGSGDIDAELTGDVADLSVDTGSGDVVLRVPENLGAMVDIETGSGGIQTEMPLTVERWAKDHVTGRIGDGNGSVNVDTGSGDVKLIRIGAALPARKR